MPPAHSSMPAPVHHGALDIRELESLGLNPETVLDFSVNSNPFGPSPRVRQALASVPLDRYPDRESLALRRALGGQMGISPDSILVGNGVAELLWLAAFALLHAGDRVLILNPTFGEYERSAQLMGANTRAWTALPETGFLLDPAAISRELDRTCSRAVFICNPNNPTGQVLPAEVISAWAQAHPSTLFIVDEAYIAFVPHMVSILDHLRENILILRSMTKDDALAGLRLGFAVGNEDLVQTITRVRPPWNVNALAQAAGLAALQDEPYYQQTLVRVQSEKKFLVDGLVSLGYTPCASRTHFFLLPVANGQEFRARLLPYGILVRDCASFGLPEYVRIAPRTRDENIRLLTVLSTISDHGS